MDKIYTKCPKCIDGVETIKMPLPGNGSETVTDTCRKCLGTGKIEASALDANLVDLFSDMSDKINDISDKVNDIKTVVDAL